MEFLQFNDVLFIGEVTEEFIEQTKEKLFLTKQPPIRKLYYENIGNIFTDFKDQ